MFINLHSGLIDRLQGILMIFNSVIDINFSWVNYTFSIYYCYYKVLPKQTNKKKSLRSTTF